MHGNMKENVSGCFFFWTQCWNHITAWQTDIQLSLADTHYKYTFYMMSDCSEQFTIWIYGHFLRQLYTCCNYYKFAI